MRFLLVLITALSSITFAKSPVTRRIPEQLWKKMPIYIPQPSNALEKMKVKDHVPKYKIAILDTGIANADLLVDVKLCKTGHYDFSTETPTLGAKLNHGSIIASIIAVELKDVDYCFVVYQLMNAKGDITVENTTRALKMASREGVKAVNLSLTGIAHSFEERDVLRDITKKGTKVFCAAGNENRNLSQACIAYPACYRIKGVNAVGALSDDNTQRSTYSNYGMPVKLYYPGSVNTPEGEMHGTSFAAPRALADFVRSLSLARKK